jgi:two-component system cell cycle response regulator DivK
VTRTLSLEDNVSMLTQRLTRHGFEVSIAPDGVQGIDMAIRERPDLILMDLGLSAHTMPGDRNKALDAGCDDHDTKPVAFERLLEKVDALIRRRSQS